jgi:ParB family transcriptional regulator, chromosome partitioning protein
MSKTTGLGQGVGLLFGEEEEEKYFFCDIDKIEPNKHQPRTHFRDIDLEELSDSIKENGVIQPLIVRSEESTGIYSLIAGERRLRASKLAGLDQVPVVVMDVENEDSLLELALIENIQRTDLNPLEEAEAYNNLIQKFGYTQEETAKRVGKKRSTITNALRLLNLPDFIKDDIIQGNLSEGHGRALLRISDDLIAVKDIRDLIIQKKLSVRQTEKLVKKSDSSKASKRKQTVPDIESLPPSYCKSMINQLTNKLSSKVYINQNGSRGKLEIEYYSSDDLERLISILLAE